MLHRQALRRPAQSAEYSMPGKPDDLGVRIAASLTRDQDRVLRALAAKHKVSVAWLIRYAVSQLVERADSVQLPLDLMRRP